MIDRVDTVVFVALERRIASILYGSSEEEGIIRSASRAESLEDLKLFAGKIEAYEHVLRLMIEIVKEMNERRVA